MEYYRSRLVRAEREAYAAMLRGYQTLERVIRVPALPGRRLSELSFLLRLDHPEIFYIESLRCRTAPGAENTELLPDYHRLSQAERERAEREKQQGEPSNAI